VTVAAGTAAASSVIVIGHFVKILIIPTLANNVLNILILD